MVLRANHTEYREIKDGQKMAYRYLGKTGLKVSVLSYGNWLTTDANTAETQTLINDCVKKCYDYGVNFFDSAEMYACGAAETQIGHAIKALNAPRKDLVVSTKLIFCDPKAPNDRGLSRKRIIEGTKASLKRLQLTYVDLIFAHRPDYDTPLEEQVRAFSWLIDNGLAHYWGTSEWTAVHFEQACAIAERLGLHKPVVEQCQYNMLVRDRFEKEHKQAFERRGMGTTIWSPLCGGFLTGKYNNGDIPAGSRGELMYKIGGHLTKRADGLFGEDAKAATVKRLCALGDIAKDIGCTQAQLALAWSIAHPDASTAILGFSRTSQIDENIKAIDVLEKWTPELEKRCNEALNNTPEMEMNWRTWKPELPRRLE